MSASHLAILRTHARYWWGIFASARRNWLESQAFIYAAALAFFTVFAQMQQSLNQIWDVAPPPGNGGRRLPVLTAWRGRRIAYTPAHE